MVSSLGNKGFSSSDVGCPKCAIAWSKRRGTERGLNSRICSVMSARVLNTNESSRHQTLVKALSGRSLQRERQRLDRSHIRDHGNDVTNNRLSYPWDIPNQVAGMSHLMHKPRVVPTLYVARAKQSVRNQRVQEGRCSVVPTLLCMVLTEVKPVRHDWKY